MSRQFTIRDIALWFTVVAIWAALASLKWLDRFGLPLSGAPGSKRVILALAVVMFLLILTVLIHIPLRGRRNGWGLAALLASATSYGILYLPNWLLDFLEL